MKQWINSRYVPAFLFVACATCVLLTVATETLFPTSAHHPPVTATTSLRPPDELNPDLLRLHLSEVQGALAHASDPAVVLPEPVVAQSNGSAATQESRELSLSASAIVTAIVWNPMYASAIVNGKLVHAGDHLDADTVVTRIEPRQVQIRRSGVLAKLKIHEPDLNVGTRENQVKEKRENGK
ncbi:hypothetical protein [Burkholderia diffusa]|uniref:hypothetical protein n=1 Tax=Burkholderia diffusa TaxID=488732 RepID=UPI0012D890B2|nr:hypothetical protein [Burkholderia diffusa]